MLWASSTAIVVVNSTAKAVQNVQETTQSPHNAKYMSTYSAVVIFVDANHNMRQRVAIQAIFIGTTYNKQDGPRVWQYPCEVIVTQVQTRLQHA